jgi:3(or 17)beta-hydroxysteroid dehydrogenase
MHATGGGSMINIASIASHLGYAIYYAYSAAKGAERSMTKALDEHCPMPIPLNSGDSRITLSRPTPS